MRKIIHIDMDAFFASVEQRDNPALKGKPVIVGGDPQGRGVVAAASYEARAFGVHSAMPLSQAKRLCPKAIFLKTRFDKYREASQKVSEIFYLFTPLVEHVALDESYLDVTHSERLFGPAMEIARRIKTEIKSQVGLTASAGVAPNKFLAKIASGLNKPDGLTLVLPEQVEEFLKELPASKIGGVGKVTARALKQMRISTIGELASKPLGELTARLGKTGERLYDLARGRDEEPVVVSSMPKSIGQEETFARDIEDPGFLRKVLLEQCERVARRARASGLKGKNVSIKVRYSNFRTISRSGTLSAFTDETEQIFAEAMKQLGRVDLKGKKMRLLGVTLASLQKGQEEQLSLFTQGSGKSAQATQAMDRIWERFGTEAIRRASLIDSQE